MLNKNRNNLIKLFLATTFIFLVFAIPSIDALAKNFKAGDIIITTKSTTKYYTGHNGIVLNNGKILHSPGQGQKPSMMSQSDLKKYYKKGSFIRPTSASRGKKAATKAYNYYVKGKGKNLPYKVEKFHVTTSTYCTKLVADAYKRARTPFMGKSNYYPQPLALDIAYPNQLKTKGFLELNKFKYMGKY